MSSVRDYAKVTHMNTWLRHPVLGDPSFDSFQRLGDAIHRSAPPYEWAVNGSIFRDHDGVWYCYAGLYPRRYGIEEPSRFRIYLSRDRGQIWEDLGWGFEDGFFFEGDDAPSDGYPDAVLCYDPKTKKYLLTYDTFTYDRQWLTEPDPPSRTTTGVALAWADSPAGPFHRLPQRLLTNGPDNIRGRFTRYYGSTVLPREKDYICFSVVDSQEHFSWGLAIMTAPKPEGPWSGPTIVLSGDRPEYFPCPVEFFPTFAYNGTVFSPATSVAMNRNYQALFAAPLEQAHDPSAWHLAANGNLWHSRDHADECLGIWGQTFQGFVDPETHQLTVLFPSKNAADEGILTVATRPWDTPHSDGFTLTAHGGPSLSPLLAAYKDFTLDAAFSCKGTVDLAFAYEGILGPNDSISDSIPAAESLRSYSALRLEGHECKVITISADGTLTTHAAATLPHSPSRIRMALKAGLLDVQVDGLPLFDQIPVAAGKTGPLALVLGAFSRIDCSRFQITGETHPYRLTYNATDALLGAGQLHPAHETADPAGPLEPDRWHRIPGGFVGQGQIAAKWNVIGSRFTLPLPQSSHFGTAGIWVDGQFQGTVDLRGSGEAVFTTNTFPHGPHAIRVAPVMGRIAITKLEVTG